jgi:hypothetical protein
VSEEIILRHERDELRAKRQRTVRRLLALREGERLWKAHSEAMQDMLRETEDDRNEAIRQRDELRRIIEPLLDDPIDRYESSTMWGRCLFCTRVQPVVDRGPTRPPLLDDDAPEEHHSDCPVLRRATLLGRDRAPEEER